MIVLKKKNNKNIFFNILDYFVPSQFATCNITDFILKPNLHFSLKNVCTFWNAHNMAQMRV